MLDGVLKPLLIISRPCRRRLCSGFLAIKDIIHEGEHAPRHPVSRHQVLYELMGEGAGMAPWTNAHTDVTARSDPAPVFKTALLIQLPAQRTVDLDLILHGNGIGGTA